MVRFGSERHGDTVTAEGTASYVLSASMLTRAGCGVTGVVAHFEKMGFKYRCATLEPAPTRNRL
jgi:hypothetical protein